MVANLSFGSTVLNYIKIVLPQDVFAIRRCTMPYNSADADRLMHPQDNDITTHYLVKREKKVVMASCVDWSPIQLALQSTEYLIFSLSQDCLFCKGDESNWRLYQTLTTILSCQGFVNILLTEKPKQKVNPQAIIECRVSHLQPSLKILQETSDTIDIGIGWFENHAIALHIAK